MVQSSPASAHRASQAAAAKAAFSTLPEDGSWRTLSADQAGRLAAIADQPSAPVQCRTRDGLQQFRLTPKGIRLRQSMAANTQAAVRGTASVADASVAGAAAAGQAAHHTDAAPAPVP